MKLDGLSVLAKLKALGPWEEAIGFPKPGQTHRQKEVTTDRGVRGAGSKHIDH